MSGSTVLCFHAIHPAAERGPREQVNLYGSGILCLAYYNWDLKSATASAANRYIVSFMDGSVGIYDYESKKISFKTEPSHNETIFDV